MAGPTNWSDVPPVGNGVLTTAAEVIARRQGGQFVRATLAQIIALVSEGSARPPIAWDLRPINVPAVLTAPNPLPTEPPQENFATLDEGGFGFTVVGADPVPPVADGTPVLAAGIALLGDLLPTTGKYHFEWSPRTLVGAALMASNSLVIGAPFGASALSASFVETTSTVSFGGGLSYSPFVADDIVRVEIDADAKILQVFLSPAGSDPFHTVDLSSLDIGSLYAIGQAYGYAETPDISYTVGAELYSSAARLPVDFKPTAGFLDMTANVEPGLPDVDLVLGDVLYVSHAGKHKGQLYEIAVSGCPDGAIVVNPETGTVLPLRDSQYLTEVPDVTSNDVTMSTGSYVGQTLTAAMDTVHGGLGNAIEQADNANDTAMAAESLAQNAIPSQMVGAADGVAPLGLNMLVPAQFVPGLNGATHTGEFARAGIVYTGSEGSIVVTVGTDHLDTLPIGSSFVLMFSSPGYPVRLGTEGAVIIDGALQVDKIREYNFGMAIEVRRMSADSYTTHTISGTIFGGTGDCNDYKRSAIVRMAGGSSNSPTQYGGILQVFDTTEEDINSDDTHEQMFIPFLYPGIFTRRNPPGAAAPASWSHTADLVIVNAWTNGQLPDSQGPSLMRYHQAAIDGDRVVVVYPTSGERRLGEWHIVRRAGTGGVSIEAEAGVTFNPAGPVVLPNQHSEARLTYVDTDTWDVTVTP